MRIIRQGWDWEDGKPAGGLLLRQIERAGRTCYKSEGSGVTVTSAEKFVRGIIESGHHSVLEHASVSVRIITDRGVTHEIVRHRLAAYSQESTRYCNYSSDRFGNEITVILPVWFHDGFDFERGIFSMQEGEVSRNTAFFVWRRAMSDSEDFYFSLINFGQSPQQARSVLPNSLKTEIVMTCNIREWRHFFSLRIVPAAHPQMRELACSMLAGFREAMPVLFDDVGMLEE